MYGYDLKSVLRYSADMRACRERLRHGSHSFYAASLLIPSDYRSPMTALYAYCRDADDAVDSNPEPAKGLERLYKRLSRIYAGRPKNHPVDRAFADVVERYDIPFALPAALLEGFEWDVTGRRYNTLSDVYAYSARVAGTVGAMMTLIMGIRDREIVSRALDLGVAMQITNICRDVGEDAAIGRVYLPDELLRSFSIDRDSWQQHPVINDGIRQSVEVLLSIAARLYRQSEWGIAQLPVRCRPGIFAARSIYAEIGAEIERNNFDSVSQRNYVNTQRKLRLLGTSMRKALTGTARDNASTMLESAFLLDAVSAARR